MQYYPPMHILYTKEITKSLANAVYPHWVYTNIAEYLISWICMLYIYTALIYGCHISAEISIIYISMSLWVYTEIDIAAISHLHMTEYNLKR